MIDDLQLNQSPLSKGHQQNGPPSYVTLADRLAMYSIQFFVKKRKVSGPKRPQMPRSSSGSADRGGRFH